MSNKLGAVVALASLLIFAVAEPADARKRRQSLSRAVQNGWSGGWCPLGLEDVVTFTADGSTATVRFQVNFVPGQRIDNVYVVEASSLDDFTTFDPVCGKGEIYSIRAPNPRPELFFELFDLEANGWWGVDAFLVGGSAHRIPFENGDTAGRAVGLDGNGWAEITIGGLEVGTEYAVGAWWYVDTFDETEELSIEVDTWTSDALFLNRGRFWIYADFFAPQTGAGFASAVPLTDDTGYLWFFDPDNVEVVVKVLNACSFANRFWVFASGLTNVEVELTVVDTATGEVRTYFNPSGQPFSPILDTRAFATCDAFFEPLIDDRTAAARGRVLGQPIPVRMNGAQK